MRHHGTASPPYDLPAIDLGHLGLRRPPQATGPAVNHPAGLGSAAAAFLP